MFVCHNVVYIRDHLLQRPTFQSCLVVIHLPYVCPLRFQVVDKKSAKLLVDDAPFCFGPPNLSVCTFGRLWGFLVGIVV